MDRALRAVGDQPGVLERRLASRPNPLRDWFDSVRWTDTHKRLAAQPVFAACSRAEIRNLRRWGDHVEVGPGELLLRENAIGYAFVVVLTGRLLMTTRGRDVATVGAGGHVGEIAILGFGPQPAAVTTLTPCELFVLGRRFLVSLAIDSPGVREGLFPGLDAREATALVRDMRENGLAAFRKMRPSKSVVSGPDVGPAIRWSPSRRAEASVFAPRQAPAITTPEVAVVRDPRLRRRLFAAGALVSALLLAVVGFAWRVPTLVAHPARPIDVSADISIGTLPGAAVNGRFILLSVTFDRPTLAGFLLSRLRGETTATRARDHRAFESTVRAEFADGLSAAVRAATKLTGIDAASLDVRFAPRDLGGPSASLVYALTLADLLDPTDLAGGRTIAATGNVDGDGRVGRVGLIGEKVKAARAAGATVLFVPQGQHPGDVGMRVVEVATVADAVAALR